jgi:hypothetical protein
MEQEVRPEALPHLPMKKIRYEYSVSIIQSGGQQTDYEKGHCMSMKEAFPNTLFGDRQRDKSPKQCEENQGSMHQCEPGDAGCHR